MASEKDPPQDPRRSKDAAIVDNLLEGLFFDHGGGGKVGGPAKQTPPPSRASRPVSGPSASSRPHLPTSRTIARSGNAGLATWSRVALGLVLAVAMTQWPYRHACGLSLAIYLSAVAVLMVAALWGGAFSWNNRQALAHLVSLGLVGWGLVLAAGEVLPRVGYARETASWGCAVAPAPAQRAGPPEVPAVEAPQGGAESPEPVPRGST